MQKNTLTQYVLGTTLIFCIVVGAPTPVSAQNLIDNGDFFYDVVGWTIWDVNNATALFRGDVGSTLGGGTGPGSMEVQVQVKSFIQWDGPYQYTTATVGNQYTVEASVFVPDSADNLATEATVVVAFIGEGQLNLGDHQFHAPIPSARGVWSRISESITAPEDTIKAQIRLNVVTPAMDNEDRLGIAYFDDVLFYDQGATQATQALFLPAAASAPGAAGTFWSTTGWFANNVYVDVDLAGAFLAQEQDNTAALSALTSIGTVPAGGFLEVEDIVALLGESGVAGGVYIEATAEGDGGLPPVLVRGTSYTFTENTQGPGAYGQGLPVVSAGENHQVTIPGVFQSTDYRTNIGVLNTSGEELILGVRVVSVGGGELGAQDWTLEPYEWKQVPVTALGVNSAAGGFVTMTRMSTTGTFRGYCSVVDQETGDAVYTAGQ